MGFQRQIDTTPADWGPEYKRKFEAMVVEHQTEINRLEARIKTLQGNRDNLKKYLDEKFAEEMKKIAILEKSAQDKISEANQIALRIQEQSLELEQKRENYRFEHDKLTKDAELKLSYVLRDRSILNDDIRVHNLNVQKLEKETVDLLTKERGLIKYKQDIKNLLEEFDALKEAEPEKVMTLRGLWEVESGRC